jgi:hypothetical protein
LIGLSAQLDGGCRGARDGSLGNPPPAHIGNLQHCRQSRENRPVIGETRVPALRKCC